MTCRAPTWILVLSLNLVKATWGAACACGIGLVCIWSIENIPDSAAVPAGLGPVLCAAWILEWPEWARSVALSGQSGSCAACGVCPGHTVPTLGHVLHTVPTTASLRSMPLAARLLYSTQSWSCHRVATACSTVQLQLLQLDCFTHCTCSRQSRICTACGASPRLAEQPPDQVCWGRKRWNGFLGPIYSVDSLPHCSLACRARWS